MKKLAIGVGTAMICTSAFAQSSVTLYGLIDEAIRYQSSSPTPGGHTISMSEGAINGTRFGFKGSEDLGGGLHAIFDLQSGFNIASGKSDQQSQLFGRYAFMGLQSDTFGTLTLGRQYGGIYSFYAFNFDPIGGGNVNATDWSLFLTGIRFDNTAEYSKQLGPVRFAFQHSFGAQAGSAGSGSTTTGSAVYAFTGGKVGLAGAESEDAQGRKLVVGSVGGMYAIGPVGLYLYGIDARRDAGFSVAAAGSGGALANTNLISNVTTTSGPQTSSRTDLFVRAGATYQMTASWSFIASYAYDDARNVSAGKNGTIQTVYGIVEHRLSKRTDVYLEVDHSHLAGASVNDPNGPLTFAGQANNFGASLSLRTVF
jgi:predicted porin